MTTEHEKEHIFQIVSLYNSQNCTVYKELLLVSSKMVLTDAVIIMFT